MKTESQIKHKLSQVRFRHLKREVRNGLSRKSDNCSFNGKVELPVYNRVGVCLHGAGTPGWNGGVCDGVLDNRAESCSLYHCANTKEGLKNDFDAFLRSSDRAHIAERYPDMAALLWALDTEAETAIESAEPIEELSAEPIKETSEEAHELPGSPEFKLSVVMEPPTPSLLQVFWVWLTGLFRG